MVGGTYGLAGPSKTRRPALKRKREGDGGSFPFPREKSR